MTRAEFDAYLADYNSHDSARIGRHFAPDIVFENFGAHHEGPEVLAYLTALSATIADVLEPQHILVDGDGVAMEAMFTITALRDAPEMPIGPMAKGEQMAMRMFAFYRTEGPLIRHIKVAGWPPVRLAASAAA